MSMKLKNYLSAKRLKRKLSKPSINASQGSINDSFADFNDSEVLPSNTTRDDMFLRPKRDGAVGQRSDMTQSFSGILPSYQSRLVQTDTPVPYTDHGSQADLHVTAADSKLKYSPLSGDPDLFFYKDSISSMEVGGLDEDETNSNLYYHSLPSNQTTYHQIREIQYNSLPSATTHTTYTEHMPSTNPPRLCSRWKRSRIKTNPWLPLPELNKTETLQKFRKINSRAEPRLSRFFSEVRITNT